MGKDNVALVVRHENQALAVDAPDAATICNICQHYGLELTALLITHHHGDHIIGIREIKNRFPKVVIYGPAKEQSLIPHIVPVYENDNFIWNNHVINVIETKGHSIGHVCYYFPKGRILFSGDTLFVMGCGRVLGGTAEELFQSLQKLCTLPDDTRLYCGHDYAETNCRFALSVESNNQLLKTRHKEILQNISLSKISLPSTLALEKASNPFMRVNNEELLISLNMQNQSEIATFKELRLRRNSFS